MSFLDALWWDELTIHSTLRLGRIRKKDKSVVFCGLAAEEAFLQLGFPFLIGLGPFLDSRPVSGHGVTFLRGNDVPQCRPVQCQRSGFPRSRE